MLMMLVLLIPNTNTFASEIESNGEKHVVYIDDEGEFSSIEEDADLLVMKTTSLENVEIEILNEVLDDGCILFIEGNDNEVIEEYLGENVDSSATTIGYCVEKVGDEYDIKYIDVEIAYLEEEEIPDENDYEELLYVVELSEDDYIAMSEVDDSINVLELREESLAYLQSGASVADNFGSTTHITYYYRQSKLNYKTAAISNKSDAETGWQQIGWGRISMYALPAGGKGSDRFNAIYTVANVCGSNNRAVSSYTTQTRLYEKDNAYLLDYTYLTGGSGTKTTTIGSSFGISTDAGLSATYSNGYSYTYDPMDCTIVTRMDDPYIVKWTIIAPDGNGYIGLALKLTPMVLIHSNKGQTVKVSARIFDINIAAAIKGNYTIANHSGSQYTWMKIKNHTMTDNG